MIQETKYILRAIFKLRGNYENWIIQLIIQLSGWGVWKVGLFSFRGMALLAFI